MSYKDLDRELVEKVNPAHVRHYLLSSEWERVLDMGDDIAVFRRGNGDDEVVVPVTKEFPEYFYRRMVEAIDDIAGYEERDSGDVLRDVLTGPSDVVRFRVDDPTVEDGTILIEDGLNLFGGAKKALVASACSVVDPQPYYKRLRRSEASSFIESCRIASEAGSFVARVVCPLDAGPSESPEGQMVLRDGEIQEDLFTRRVTSALLEALNSVVTETDRDAANSLFDEPTKTHLSANLCDALLSMQPTGPNSSLTVSSHWAATKRPPANRLSAVELRSEHFSVVEDLANGLRPKREPEESSFVGTVDELAGAPGSDGRTQGQVTLRLRDGDDLLTVRVNLDADDYAKAGEAHLHDRRVKVWGTLRRRARIHRMTDCDRIELLDELE